MPLAHLVAQNLLDVTFITEPGKQTNIMYTQILPGFRKCFCPTKQSFKPLPFQDREFVKS